MRGKHSQVSARRAESQVVLELEEQLSRLKALHEKELAAQKELLRSSAQAHRSELARLHALVEAGTSEALRQREVDLDELRDQLGEAHVALQDEKRKVKRLAEALLDIYRVDQNGVEALEQVARIAGVKVSMIVDHTLHGSTVDKVGLEGAKRIQRARGIR